jgi:hypothetical protein
LPEYLLAWTALFVVAFIDEGRIRGSAREDEMMMRVRSHPHPYPPPSRGREIK